jgi:hypothetical protein
MNNQACRAAVLKPQNSAKEKAMIADKDLLVAKYIPERTKSGYMARICIELVRASGEKHDLDYIYPREFREMNDALAKAFQLVGRWRARYAPDADLVIEPPSRP